jgi:hypothetical protein
MINFTPTHHPPLQLTMDASDPRLAELVEGPGPTAYVPRLLPAWAAADQGAAHRVVDGSLLFFDITGFTPLTERLARKGREGAEELSNLLDTVFSQLLTDAEDEVATFSNGVVTRCCCSSTMQTIAAALPGQRCVCTELLRRSDAPRRLLAESSCVLPLASTLVQST